MAAGELLLELLSEEIPARMQRRAIEDLTGLLRDKLAAAAIPAATLRGYVTPRRLTIIAEGIPEHQPDRREERRGPRVGAPQQAIDGFLRAVGLASIDRCEIRDTGRGEFHFAVLQRPGRAAAEVLPELLHAAIAELPWPKSMRYPASSLRWVRPLVSVICLFDGAVLPLALDQVPVGRTTRGHRFLSEGEITVDNAADYLGRLKAAYVIVDRQEREKLIRQGFKDAIANKPQSVKPDDGLLDEVIGLVEYPIVLMGAIDSDFVRPVPEGLPPEVLATAMRTHQKYFSCRYPDGTAAPHFVFVANNAPPHSRKTIIAGNERVLRARLADARFFWERDRKVRLEDRVEALKNRVYHARLGSVRDKVRRMELVSDILVPHVPDADIDRANRAVLLAKADLSTGMVGEFPELQGVMGQYYARHDGEDERVTIAIADHYKPLGPSDSCPREPDSIVVALADKIDALVAFFAISLPPTGSRDPFALRRAALGIIRIILENRVRLPLKEAFTAGAEIFYLQRQVFDWEDRVPALYAELISFVVDRLKVHLREQGTRHDLIAAAFAQLGKVEDDLVRLLARVDALAKFLATDDGTNLLIAYRRASNIVAIEERRDGRSYDGDPEQNLVQQAEEKALARALAGIAGSAGQALMQERFDEAMSALARLRQPVDAFFDKVTVNTDDAALRENRLRLLSRIRAVMNQVADFSQIEG